LWNEYEYRHDMVWKLAFRITAVAAALLIAPFLTHDSVQRAVGYGLIGLPLLAIVVIAGGLFTLQSELDRMGLIRKAYRGAQNEVLAPYVSADELRQERALLEGDDGQPKEHFYNLNFDQRVRLYCIVLLVAASIYVIILARWWLPDLVNEARHSR
jgi:hypothetical protein